MLWYVIAFISVLVATTFWVFRRAERRAEESRIDPGMPTIECSRDEVEERILSLDDRPELVVRRIDDGRLSVTWDLDQTHSRSSRLNGEGHETFLLELNVCDEPRKEVRVRYGVGEIDTSSDVPQVGHPVRWEWPLTPDFVEEPAPSGDIRTMEGLVAPVRETVLRSGYAWQPAVAVSP